MFVNIKLNWQNHKGIMLRAPKWLAAALIMTSLEINLYLRLPIDSNQDNYICISYIYCPALMGMLAQKAIKAIKLIVVDIFQYGPR